jgi:hypothetical protein
LKGMVLQAPRSSENKRKFHRHPNLENVYRQDRAGFEFLGYHFRPGTLTVAQKTVERFVARAIRLYEQEPGESCDSSRLGTYVQGQVGHRAGVPRS